MLDGRSTALGEGDSEISIITIRAEKIKNLRSQRAKTEKSIKSFLLYPFSI